MASYQNNVYAWLLDVFSCMLVDFPQVPAYPLPAQEKNVLAGNLLRQHGHMSVFVPFELAGFAIYVEYKNAVPTSLYKI